jgi:hypothetical protein
MGESTFMVWFFHMCNTGIDDFIGLLDEVLDLNHTLSIAMSLYSSVTFLIMPFVFLLFSDIYVGQGK